MKKIFLMMLAAVLFAACDKEDEGPQIPTADYDYSSAIGMTYAQMLNTYGEPAMAFDGFYSYNIGDGKTESLTMMTSPDNNKVYMAMQILAEGAYKFEDICTYFASKYTKYAETEAGTVEEDGETDEVEATAKFGNTEKEEDATLVIEISGSSSVSYVNPKNMPAEPEPGAVEFADVAPQAAAAMFLGRSWEEVQDEYGNAIISYGGKNMIMVEDNDDYQCLYFEIEDGIITQVNILFDDFEDDDAAAQAYFKSLGYMVTDCGEDEETGFHMYLCMNMETFEMFTYSNCIATFTWVDPNAEDYDDDED